MRAIGLIIVLHVFLLLTGCAGHGGQEIITIENELFVKSFLCNSKDADIIRPRYTCKETGRILNVEGAAYFEMVINGQLLTSEEKLWVFKGINNRRMENGGSEYSLEF